MEDEPTHTVLEPHGEPITITGTPYIPLYSVAVSVFVKETMSVYKEAMNQTTQLFFFFVIYTRFIYSG